MWATLVATILPTLQACWCSHSIVLGTACWSVILHPCGSIQWQRPNCYSRLYPCALTTQCPPLLFDIYRLLTRCGELSVAVPLTVLITGPRCQVNSPANMGVVPTTVPFPIVGHFWQFCPLQHCQIPAHPTSGMYSIHCLIPRHLSIVITTLYDLWVWWARRRRNCLPAHTICSFPWGILL